MELPDYSTLLEAELEELWKEQEQGETVLIDGVQQTEPVLGAIESINADSLPHEFEIKMGALALWHELEQCGVSVSNRDLLSFVQSDIEEYGLQAANAYLEIGQAHLKKAASFLSIIGFRREVPPKFICSGIDSVTRTSNHVTLRGKCLVNE